MGCSGAESPGWFDVLPKNSAWDVIHEQAHCYDKAANHQLPIAAAFWIIEIVSAKECSSLMQNLMQILCSTYSVILNVTAPQYTCSLNGIYRPHWLVQWSHHDSHMRTQVHSPWLPGYINVVQTVLVILTMAGLFLDRPHMLTIQLGSIGKIFSLCCHLLLLAREKREIQLNAQPSFSLCLNQSFTCSLLDPAQGLLFLLASPPFSLRGYLSLWPMAPLWG